MKILPLKRTGPNDMVKVDCADGEVSVYSRCAYCANCEGVVVGKRLIPMPQKQKADKMRYGMAGDDDLLNAQMMFNTLIRDGSAIACKDDANKGFKDLYSL